MVGVKKCKKTRLEWGMAAEMRSPATVFRSVLLAISASALAGCLVTVEPAFDETNSVSPSESAVFGEYRRARKAFLEEWGMEDYVPIPPDEDLRVIMETPRLVVQQKAEGGEEDSEVLYSYTSPTMIVGTPHQCLVDTNKIEEIERIAEKFDVAIVLDEPSEGYPPLVIADGPKPALREFILEVFRNGPIDCLTTY